MRPVAVVVTIGLVLLHLTLRVGLGIGSGAPDFMLLALLVAARELPLAAASGVGLLLGLLEDALAVLSFGATALTFAVIGAVGGATRDLFLGDSPLFGFSYVFLGKLARDALHWVLVGPELREPFVRSVVLEGGVAALYVAAVGMILFTVTGLRWDASRARP